MVSPRISNVTDRSNSTIVRVDAHDIETFARRQWPLTSRSKTAYWADQFRHDRQSTFRASQLLLEYARSVQPDFPTGADRERDLAAHLSLRAALDRAAHAFTRR
jgi:hypothetical protein